MRESRLESGLVHGPRAAASAEVDAGFNLVGHLTTRMGLGRAARMTLDLMQANRWPVSIVDLSFGGLERVPLGAFAPVADIRRLPRTTTLLHMNPEQIIGGLLLPAPELLGILSRRYLATVPYWELPVLPERWIPLLRGVDEVLAPSRFIETTVKRALEGMPDAPPVTRFVQAVRPPSDVAPQRDRWFGPRSRTTVFLASFDVVSDPARKNPEGVVEAFCAAAEQRQDLTLVLKAGYAARAKVERYRSLAQRVASDSRIVVLEDTLSDADMWSLLASADAYVSLHRAEGLGLGMMESMALGTPVIGTNWSGNTDFMTSEDSILVPYELVPVGGAHAPLYRESAGRAEWAEPDLQFAAEAMRRVGDDRQLRSRLGLAARESAERRWLEYTRADALGATMAASTTLEPAAGPRARRLARLEGDMRALRRADRLSRLRPTALAEKAKRAAVSSLRAMGLKPAAPDVEVASGSLEVVDPYDTDQRMERNGRR
jgi:glycosyltransferase involved in cell wall biosynthesis